MSWMDWYQSLQQVFGAEDPPFDTAVQKPYRGPAVETCKP